MKAIKFPKIFSRKQKDCAPRRRAAAPHRAAAELRRLSEPNMKLSRALLIVLLLHVVAVAGIIAFNAIKSRQGATRRSSARATLPSPRRNHEEANGNATVPGENQRRNRRRMIQFRKARKFTPSRKATTR